MISALHLLIFLFTRLKHLTLNPFNHFTPNPHRRDDNDHTPNTSYFTLHNSSTLHTSRYTTSSLSSQATSCYTTLHLHTTTTLHHLLYAQLLKPLYTPFYTQLHATPLAPLYTQVLHVPPQSTLRYIPYFHIRYFTGLTYS